MTNKGLPGKNDRERDAWIRTKLFKDREVLLDAERLERSRVLDLEIQKDIRRCQENILAIENGKEA